MHAFLFSLNIVCRNLELLGKFLDLLLGLDVAILVAFDDQVCLSKLFLNPDLLVNTELLLNHGVVVLDSATFLIDLFQLLLQVLHLRFQFRDL